MPIRLLELFVFKDVYKRQIPVLSAHSESVYIETKEVAPIDEVKAAIAAFPGAVLEDDVANQVYPQAVNAVGSRDTFVGRIRKDLDAEKGIHMWVVSDNLLKGAAWNSVQIAETPVSYTHLDVYKRQPIFFRSIP